MPYTAYMENALVTDNAASSLGGGMWLCPTGGATNRVTNGAAIVGNTAADAGDDLVSLRADRVETTPGMEPKLSMDNRMLGNWLDEYYADGGVVNDTSLLGTANGDPRYAAQAPADRTLVGGVITDKTDDIALKTVASDEGVAAARSSAQLFIQDNDATYGGGIGTNGQVQFGENPVDHPTHDLTVDKTWAQPDAQHPDSIVVDLFMDGVQIDRKTITADEGWTHTFKDVPDYSDETIEGGVPAVYTVVEEPVDGFTATQDEKTDAATGAQTFTVTNSNSAVPGPGPNPDFQGEIPDTTVPTPDNGTDEPDEQPEQNEEQEPEESPETSDEAGGVAGALAFAAAGAALAVRAARKRADE